MYNKDFRIIVYVFEILDKIGRVIRKVIRIWVTGTINNY